MGESKERVQFDFSPEALAHLDATVVKMDAATRAECIRNALKVYEWLVNDLSPDDVIEVRDAVSNEIILKTKISLLLK